MMARFGTKDQRLRFRLRREDRDFGELQAPKARQLRDLAAVPGQKAVRPNHLVCSPGFRLVCCKVCQPKIHMEDNVMKLADSSDLDWLAPWRRLRLGRSRKTHGFPARRHLWHFSPSFTGSHRAFAAVQVVQARRLTVAREGEAKLCILAPSGNSLRLNVGATR